jgi:beta-1,4-mannosyltransferase
MSITIVCLPIAGSDNPYQKLMMNGLRSGGLNVLHGIKGKFGAFTRSAVRFRPHFIHLDWLQSFYIRRSYWLTFLFFPLFIIDILITKYVLGVKFVWTLHNIYPHDSPTYGPYKWARNFFARQCEWIRVFDEGTVQRVCSTFNISINKIIVIREGNYVDYYKNNVNRYDALKKLGLPNNKLIMLYFGLIKPYKGILELVKAFETCKYKNHAILLIVGKSMDNSYTELIKKAIKCDTIKFYDNFIIDTEVQYYFKACDIVVLPFKSIENSGTVTLAMGFSKPVVAPNIGILQQKLLQQKELLYSTEFISEIVIEQIIEFHKNELEEIGSLNLTEVLKSSWKDFVRAFS